MMTLMRTTLREQENIWDFASLLYLYLLKCDYKHVMNLSTLIKQYFSSKNEDLTIDVFDEKNIYDVYQRVVGVLTQHIEIETTVLQALSYVSMRFWITC